MLRTFTGLAGAAAIALFAGCGGDDAESDPIDTGGLGGEQIDAIEEGSEYACADFVDAATMSEIAGTDVEIREGLSAFTTTCLYEPGDTEELVAQVFLSPLRTEELAQGFDQEPLKGVGDAAYAGPGSAKVQVGETQIDIKSNTLDADQIVEIAEASAG